MTCAASPEGGIATVWIRRVPGRDVGVEQHRRLAPVAGVEGAHRLAPPCGQEVLAIRAGHVGGAEIGPRAAGAAGR